MTVNPAWFDTSACLVGGTWRATAGVIPVTDPSTGQAVCTIAQGTGREIDDAVRAARTAFDGDWGRTTATDRGRMLMRLSALISDRAEDLARLEATDVGKPLRQAQADALALARYAEFYGGAADKLMGETIPYQSGYTVFTLREPHGVTGHIVPLNYPMQILGRSLLASLAAGNAAVVKPAEDACLTALALARLAGEAGFPPGAVNIVPGLGAEAGAALAAHPGIDHLSFTGSVATGRTVQAAAAANVVPVTLELGGKSPHLVFADADFDAALPIIVSSAIQNAGQTCSAGSRVLVHRSRYDELLDRLVSRYRALRAGPAMQDHDLGPIISARQRDRIAAMLAGAGAFVAARGEVVANAPSGGFYLPPVLLAGVPPEHALAQQEVFGPVQVVLPFDDDDHAVALANGTPFGLVAAVWTQDAGRAMRLPGRLRAGQVFVNNYGAGGGVELPFGGRGQSGHGREKGFEALYGFTALKTVAHRHG